MKQLNNIITRVFFFAVVILFASQSVFAFAISSAYYADNPLYLKAGETQDIFLTLQNLAGSEDVSVRAEITGGAEYSQLIDLSNVYLVPVGEKTKVNLRVSAPTSAKKGDSFPVNIIFTTVKGGEGGTLALASSIGQGFKVVIGEEKDFIGPPQQPHTPAQESKSRMPSLLIYGVIGLIFLLLIAYFLKYSARKNSSRKRFKR